MLSESQLRGYGQKIEVLASREEGSFLLDLSQPTWNIAGFPGKSFCLGSSTSQTDWGGRGRRPCWLAKELILGTKVPISLFHLPPL